MNQLPTNQLLGLCQMEMNEPVRASDVPTGFALRGDEREMLLTELGTRMGLVEVKGMPDVMGAAEAAAALDVSQSNLRAIANLPDPIARLSATPLWSGAEIRTFAEKRRAKRRHDTHGDEQGA